MICKKPRLYVVASVVLLAPFVESFASGQEGTPPTFQIEISLPSPTIHVGESLAIRVVIANPTDHIVYAGNAIILEIMNEKGEDVGPQAMGADKRSDSGFVLSGKREAIRSKSKYAFTWHPKLEAGHLVPGTYNVRIHKLDTGSKTDIYSNIAVLTVLR